LRVNGGLIVKGAILESQCELNRYLIILRDLNQVTHRKHFALKRPEHQKSVSDAFFVTHSDRRRAQNTGEKNAGEKDETEYYEDSKQVEAGGF
jgi:hypothetical protein